MKRIVRAFTLIVVLGGFSLSAGFAQLSDLSNVLVGGTDDAEQILDAYLTPYGNILGANLNGGWYNTAKVHGMLGFDLTFTTSFAFAPDEDKTFDFHSLSLLDNSSIGASISGNNISPTVAGSKVDDRPTIEYRERLTGDDKLVASYRALDGTGLPTIPTPMIKLGFGLPGGTELMGRFFPKVNIGDNGKFGLWGLGIKHDIKQHIPALKRVPVLHISAMAAYTKLNAAADISFKPEDIFGSDIYYVDGVSANDFDGQTMELGIKSFTGNLLVSANLPVICFYGGVGFSKTSTNLQMLGNYAIPTVESDPTSDRFGDTKIGTAQVQKDPIDIDIDNEEGVTQPRLNIGMRFKMGIVTFNLDYTYSAYSVATAGLGISFR